MNLNNIVFEISNQLLFEMSKVFNNEQINLAVIFNPTEGVMIDILKFIIKGKISSVTKMSSISFLDLNI